MTLTYVKLILVAVFWGGTFVAGRSLAGTAHPVDASFLRFSIASILLLGITLYREGIPRLTLRQIPVILLLGSSGIFAYNLFFFEGLTTISAGRAALIIALNPVAITLTSALIHKEPMTLRSSLGVLLSFTGAITVISHGDFASLITEGIGRGELMISGCVLSWTTYSVIGKTAMRGMSLLSAVSCSSVAGTLLLFAVVLLRGGIPEAADYPLAAWGAIGYLGLFGTVIGFLWYFQGIRVIGASRAAVFINFVPVSGVLLAAIILDEPITTATAVGGFLVICGSYLTNSTPKRPTGKAP